MFPSSNFLKLGNLIIHFAGVEAYCKPGILPSCKTDVIIIGDTGSDEVDVAEEGVLEAGLGVRQLRVNRHFEQSSLQISVLNKLKFFYLIHINRQCWCNITAIGLNN